MVEQKVGVDEGVMSDLHATAVRSSAARYRLGLMLVTLSAVAWSTAGYFTRLVPLDTSTTLFWRGIFGSITGLAFIIAQERSSIWRAFHGIGRTGILFSLFSTAAMAAFLGALKLTTVAHVAIIYATVPFAAAGFVWLAMREKPPRRPSSPVPLPSPVSPSW